MHNEENVTILNKTGRGRKPGSKNKKTYLEDVARESGITDVMDLKAKVLTVFLEALTGDSKQYRFAAAQGLAKYMFPQFNIVKGSIDGKIEVSFPGLTELSEVVEPTEPKSNITITEQKASDTQEKTDDA